MPCKALLVLTVASSALLASAEQNPGSFDLAPELAVLERLAGLSISLELQVSGIAYRQIADAVVSDANPYAEHVKRAGSTGNPDFLHRQWLTLDGARMAVADFEQVWGEEEPSLRVAWYWDGTKCLRARVSQALARITTDLSGLDAQYWPQDFLGFFGATPLCRLVEFAQLEGDLQISSEGSSTYLTFPVDPTFSTDPLTRQYVPRMRLGFAAGTSGPKIASQRITLHDGLEYQSVEVKGWQMVHGVDLPTSFELCIGVFDYGSDDSLSRTGELRTVGSLRLTESPLMDGQGVFSLVHETGFFSSPSGATFVSPAGASAIVRRAAAAFHRESNGRFSEDLVLGATRRLLADQLALSQARSVEWPRLANATVEEYLQSRMHVFEANTAFCSQLSCALLLLLEGHDVSLEEILEKNPEHLLTLQNSVDILSTNGLDYVPARVADLARLGSSKAQPFLLMLEGESSSAGHLAVAQWSESANEFVMWSAPDRLEFLTIASMARKSEGLVCLIPRSWEEKAGVVRSEWLPWILLGPLLGGSWMIARRRMHAPVVSLALLAVGTTLASCDAADPGASTARTESPTPDLREQVDILQSPSRVHVHPGEAVQFSLALQNIGAGEILVRSVMATCQCIKYVGPESISLTPGTVVDVPFRAHGFKPGISQQEIRLMLSLPSSDKGDILTVPCMVVIGERVFTVPRVPQLSGRVGDHLEDAMEVYLLADEAPADSQFVLQAMSETGGVSLHPEAKGPGSGVTEGLYTWSIDWRILEDLPGIHDLTFVVTSSESEYIERHSTRAVLTIVEPD